MYELAADGRRVPIRCCEQCAKTEDDNVKLLLCAACRSSLYCSKKCQVANRQLHKFKCRSAVRREEELSQLSSNDPSRKRLELTDELRRFTAKNRATLGHAAIQAINMHNDHDAPNKFALEVHVERVQHARKTQTCFRALRAVVRPLEYYATITDLSVLVHQRARYHHKNKTEDGMMGCILIILQCVPRQDSPRPVHCATFCAPDAKQLLNSRKLNWEEDLIKDMPGEQSPGNAAW
ncbi:hypothetical protein BOTBODRAFT_37659 [Botryobasidium botryosum FD-172 SS1]|uniref:MYND-type domain-containing protein n=1 Tax=Botryobasidium botryosum (strain FD-172 SS1) TaxID=930990 RepID=A0A067MB37_BOTB1|nr:hypothetical protein BOTBODRAFT_37659 [Botryobasidium botryosum FD-172 SS1]